MKTEPKTHELKCWLAYFQAIIDGKKAFEYRYNDRDYQVGDVLHLREWHQNENRYTGRELKVEVTYALYGPNFGCAKDHAVLSIRPLPAPQPGGGGEAEGEQVIQQWCRNDGGEIETFEDRIPLPENYIPGEYERHEQPRCSKCGTYYETEDGPCTTCNPTPPIALPVRAQAAQEELEVTKVALRAAGANCGRMERELAEVRAELDRSKTHRQEQRQRLAVLEPEVPQLRTQIAALSRELEESREGRADFIKLLASTLGVETDRQDYIVMHIQSLRAELEEAKAERDGLKQQIGWHEEANADHRRWVRHLDVLWNGEAGAAKQAALIDIVAQIERELPALRAAPRSETEGRDKERLDALDLMAVEMVEGTDCVSLTLFMKPGQKIRDAIDDLTSSVLAHDEKGAGE